MLLVCCVASCLESKAQKRSAGYQACFYGLWCKSGGSVGYAWVLTNTEPAMSKLKDIEWLFNGRPFDREIIVLRVRWYLQ